MRFQKLDKSVLTYVHELTKVHSQRAAAEILNKQGFRTSTGRPLEQTHISVFLRTYNIRTHKKPRGKI